VQAYNTRNELYKGDSFHFLFCFTYGKLLYIKNLHTLYHLYSSSLFRSYLYSRSGSLIRNFNRNMII